MALLRRRTHAIVSPSAILPRTTTNDTVRNCVEVAAYRLEALA
jgi:hypothetical protein